MSQELSQEFIAECKAALEKQREEVQALLSTVADKDTGDHVPGEFAAKFPNFGEENYLDGGSDSADEVEVFEENLAVTGDMGEHLAAIDAALARIEAGTYGVDIHTGEAISEDRLRANPAAETAIAV